MDQPGDNSQHLETAPEDNPGFNLQQTLQASSPSLPVVQVAENRSHPPADQSTQDTITSPTEEDLSSEPGCRNPEEHQSAQFPSSGLPNESNLRGVQPQVPSTFSVQNQNPPINQETARPSTSIWSSGSKAVRLYRHRCTSDSSLPASEINNDMNPSVNNTPLLRPYELDVNRQQIPQSSQPLQSNEGSFQHQQEMMQRPELNSEPIPVDAHTLDVSGATGSQDGPVRNHRRYHSEAIYRCKFCDSSYVYNKCLLNHLINHHYMQQQVRRYTCFYCFKTYTNILDLRLDLCIHLRIPLHECPKCLKSFSTMAYLKIHMQRHESSGEKNAEQRKK